MHERRFNGGLDRLRSPERMALLEVNRAVSISIKDITVGKVLDIGTGTGIFAEAFSNLGCDVTGIDVSEEMLTAASNFVPSGKFNKAPAENIPFDDKSFDLTFFGLVLHETDDLLKALLEAKRVTKQRIAILEWPYVKGEQGPPLEHRIKPEIFESLIKDAGFQEYKKNNLQNLELILLKI